MDKASIKIEVINHKYIPDLKLLLDQAYNEIIKASKLKNGTQNITKINNYHGYNNNNKTTIEYKK